MLRTQKIDSSPYKSISFKWTQEAMDVQYSKDITEDFFYLAFYIKVVMFSYYNFLKYVI